MFSLFTSEISKESNSLEKINSKLKILQLYSKGSSEDIYYLGDSFENMENVDLTQKYNFSIGSTIDGYLTLPVISGAQWTIGSVSIKSKDNNGNILSNGTSGNFHMAIRKNVSDNPNSNNQEDYKFIFEERIVNNLNNIYLDSNPETYFEFEKLKVSNLLGPNYDFEFQYLDRINNRNSFINWNQADNTPLKLVIEMTKGDSLSSPANSISIQPFFGYDNNVSVNLKITSVVLESSDSNGQKIEEIISKPIIVGTSVVPTDVQNSAYYFYKKAVIKFAERNLLKATVTFEQNQSSPITIKHAYWKIANIYSSFDFNNSSEEYAYRQSLTKTAPPGVWAKNSRFSPNIIFSRNQLSNISGVDSTISSLVPPITNPEIVGSSSRSSRNVNISGDTQISYGYYLMKVFDKKQNKYIYIDFLKTLNTTEYEYEKTLVPPNKEIFEDWWPASFKIQGYEKEGDEQPKRFFTGSKTIDPNDSKWATLTLPYATNPDYVPPSGTEKIPEAVFDWWMMKYKLIGVTKLPSYLNEDKPAYYLGELYTNTASQIESEYVEKTAAVKAKYNLTLNKEYEILSNGQKIDDKSIEARRWFIGLRDISVSSEAYQNQCEIISKPYNFLQPIEYLMLYSDYSIPIIDSRNEDYHPISYYVSIDDGASWLPISPAEDPFSFQIPEIYCFNSSILSENRIPGVAYLSSPKKVNSVRVKIVLKKPYNTNGTPKVNYYQLAVKVLRV